MVTSVFMEPQVSEALGSSCKNQVITGDTSGREEESSDLTPCLGVRVGGLFIFSNTFYFF